MSAVQRLRAATAAAHDAVDALYGRYDLTDRGSYAAFLRAHARALPAVERALSKSGSGSGSDLPAWRERMTALAGDLADLGVATPVPLPFDAPSGGAEAWGMLYVVEGSRLGGIMLERQVAEGLPRRYLASRHLAGEWRALLGGLEAAAVDEAWERRAIDAAQATFDLYGRAAA